MGYHQTTGTAQHTQDLMDQLTLFLTGTVGWTLHDDGSGDPFPYAVLASSGESGKEALFLRLRNEAATHKVMVRAFHHWDATTHTGVNAAYHASYTYISTYDNKPFLYWFYADLDHWFVVVKKVTSYYGHYAGIIQRFWSPDVATAQSAIAAGTDVVVPVDDASILQPGQAVMLKDQAHIEPVQVTAVDGGSTPPTVTLAQVSRSYALGAHLGEDPQPVIVGRYNSPGGFFALNHATGYSSPSGQNGLCKGAHGDLQDAASVDDRKGLTLLFPWLVGQTAANAREVRGQLIGVYATGSVGLDSEDVIHVGDQTYRAFNLATAGFTAVRESP